MLADVTHAPLVILLFLAACLALMAGFAVTVVAAATGRRRTARAGLIGLAAVTGLYAAALLAASAFSKEYVLGRGVEKHFCEMDCHLAYAVTAVGRSGGALVVTLRTRFDESTIGAQRPRNAPLRPGPRELWVLDAAGNRYPPLPDVSGPPLDQPLTPGASYETRLRFAVPAAARDLRLWVKNAPWPDTLLIGHENSPFHGKVLFDLGEAARDSSASAR